MQTKLRKFLLPFDKGSSTSKYAVTKILGLNMYTTINLPVVLYGCGTWSLTSRKENYLRGFENKVLRNALGPEGDVVENGGKYIIRKFLSLSSGQILFV